MAAWIATNGKAGPDLRYRSWLYGWHWTMLPQDATQFARRVDVERVFGDEDTCCAIYYEPLHEQEGVTFKGQAKPAIYPDQYTHGKIMIIAACWFVSGVATGWLTYILWH